MMRDWASKRSIQRGSSGFSSVPLVLRYPAVIQAFPLFVRHLVMRVREDESAGIATIVHHIAEAKLHEVFAQERCGGMPTNHTWD